MPKRIVTKQDDREKINVRERLTDNVLDLSLMNISVVPVNDIKPLKRATVLDLSNNVIIEINSNFTTLVQLTKLDLSNNKIRQISDDFGNLVNLRHLDLYNNHIERLPLSFGRLKKLKYLDLKNNRLNPVFSKIIGTCTDQKDCMEAARKAVSFMVDIEQQVLEERRKDKEAKECESQQEHDKGLKESTRTDKPNTEKKKKNKKKSKLEEHTPLAETQKDKAMFNNTSSHIAKPKTADKKLGKRIAQCVLILGAATVLLLSINYFLNIDLFNDIFGQKYSELMEEYIK